MNFLSLIVLVASAIVLASGQTNYCTLPSCGSRPHIACGHSGDFDTTCPAVRRMVDISTYIPTILNYHNNKRNLVAAGSVSPFSPATRMATMEWHSELASLAALNVKQCKMQHDQCRNTQAFSYSGQNLATVYYTGPESGFSESWLMNYMMDNWWNENTSTTPAQIASYPSTSPAAVIGHFTAMIGERQKYVGCAVSRYLDPVKGNVILLGCNYASTNIVGWATYTAGAAASGCTTGSNAPTYPSLCSPAETGYFW